MHSLSRHLLSSPVVSLLALNSDISLQGNIVFSCDDAAFPLIVLPEEACLQLQ